ncbi:MAG: cation:dicarboxylase symporter family transporter [candidate division Zixibacteria bacterium]|nr:cation:dicarboxylase symporter family transporter [candidate division Zixibacteria bacterium]
MNGYKTEQDKMSNKTIYWILFGSIFGTILGATFGYYLPDLMLSFSFIGSIFLNGLKVIIIPLIITSIIVGITSIGNISKLSRTTVNTLFYFFSTTIIAVLIGTVLVMIFEPGVGVGRPDSIPQIIQDLRASNSFNVIDSIIPSNIHQAVINGNYLGIIILTIIFSLVLTTMSRQGKVIIDFFKAVNDVIFKLINILLIAVPIGLFFLVGSVVAENNQTIFNMTDNLSSFMLVVLAGFIIHGFIVLPLILKFFAHQSPIASFKNLIPAMATAFGSGSSTASLSITYHCVIEDCEVDKRAGSFVLPLGSTINVGGTAMYAVIVAFFIAQVFGVNLTISQMLLMAVTAVILSFGLTSLPHSTMFLALILLGVGDYPLEAYAGFSLLLITDWFFDRLKAGLNVWSDAVGAIVIGETFEFKTTSRITKSKTVKKDIRRGKRTDTKKSTSAIKPKIKKSETRKKVSAKETRPKREKKVDDKIKIREFGSNKRSTKAPVNKNENTGSPFELKPPSNSFSEYDEKPVKTAKPKSKPAKQTIQTKVEQKPEKEKSEKVTIALPKPPKNLPFPIRVEKTDKSEKRENKEILPVATVEKELSKVAKRLAALEVNELKDEKPLDKENKTEESTVDFIDEKDNDITTDEKVETIKATETTEEIEPSNEDNPNENKPEPAIQFGRTSKKPKTKKESKIDDQETKPEPEPEKEQKTEYNLEKQSFGRSPKKKVRK